ncbi:MAG: alpha/beta hydrolase family protein [bacterium]
MKSFLKTAWLTLWIGSIVLPACPGERRVDRIHPAASLPESTPWDLKALSQPPSFQWLDSTSPVRPLLYEGLPYQTKQPTKVFAYYATPGRLAGDPTLDQNLPAVVLVHGGGGRAFPQWAELWARRGYAAIAMDLEGRGTDKEPLPSGGPEQNEETAFGRIDRPVNEQWPYHAVADVILAHSLIRSFLEVDPRRTAVTGISWGGYLTCIVAGLDNRFQAAVPVYGCGFLHENSVWRDWFENKATPAQRDQWVRLWDPSQYVGSAAMPMLFVNGGKDFAYPPDSYAKTYARVKCSKNIRFTPELDHGHIFDRPPEIQIFIGQYLKKGVPLPLIHSVKIQQNEVQARVRTKTALKSAELHYTMDPVRVENAKRNWTSVPAGINGKRISATLPEEAITIWFLTVTDERGAVVSSELVFPHARNP